MAYRMLRACVLIGVVSAVFLFASGCSSALGIWPVAQSRYTGPDVTIVPIGPTDASANDWFFTFGGVVDLMHPDIPQQAMQKAIRMQKADLLINYTLSLRATRIGIPIIESLNFWWLTWTAEGTAAKMEYMTPEPPAPETKKVPQS